MCCGKSYLERRVFKFWSKLINNFSGWHAVIHRGESETELLQNISLQTGHSLICRNISRFRWTNWWILIQIAGNWTLTGPSATWGDEPDSYGTAFAYNHNISPRPLPRSPECCFLACPRRILKSYNTRTNAKNCLRWRNGLGGLHIFPTGIKKCFSFWKKTTSRRQLHPIWKNWFFFVLKWISFCPWDVFKIMFYDLRFSSLQQSDETCVCVGWNSYSASFSTKRSQKTSEHEEKKIIKLFAAALRLFLLGRACPTHSSTILAKKVKFLDCENTEKKPTQNLDLLFLSEVN